MDHSPREPELEEGWLHNKELQIVSKVRNKFWFALLHKPAPLYNVQGPRCVKAGFPWMFAVNADLTGQETEDTDF